MRFETSLIVAAGSWWFERDLLPFDALVHWLNLHLQKSVLIKTNGTRRLAHDDRDCFGTTGDRCGGPVPGSQPFGHVQIFVQNL